MELLDLAFPPLKWLGSFWTHQTHIRLVTPPVIQESKPPALPVHDAGGGAGTLLFGITTRARDPVTVSKVQVNFSAPLQLLNPGKKAFFTPATSLDPERPFCVVWDGAAPVRRDLIQAFALAAHFVPGMSVALVHIVVHAQRQGSTLGRFALKRRLQVTVFPYLVVLKKERILGLCLPPKCSFTSLQPFLIEGGFFAVGGPGPVLAHEIFRGGTTSSTRIDLPGDQV
jgi:hypothetical protein